MIVIIFLVEDDPEGGYVARAIGESIFTQADTIAELKTLAQDAVQCHYPDQQERPKPIRLHSVHDEVIASNSHAAAHNEDL
ncbi:2-oxoisovalerate dehydrogenase [Leptolyngbya sp. FACHB-321]|uniref:type II toxin-antitoxin system HicB family antitoxin n=1 Tax=Leptolyngbya sp. FACHB-321 TaxID=2692807 RepID=UPI001682E316|nr:2-oxoisovalerate dehydrogenase [Leptolyngbya sp. FACHB-321]MBD2035566.1 2-oxoisovalerate dehydrogenase [Leptolyngbya sp. FACHB-321]